ncbi:retrovirus-related pol polyprotein from transposon TNT 1-94, partial [Tanacetum coccineum]
KKGGSYSAVSPRPEPRKFNKWKKHDIMESVISCEIAKDTWTDFFHSFIENSDDEADERTSEEYLKDLDIEFHERALSQGEPKAQKDYKTEYKKLKAKLALLEASPPTSQSSKSFQPKDKGLVTETFDWDEEEVSDNEEETQVKVLMALADDELSVGKNYARNGEWIDITMKKVNILLSMDENSDWQNYLKYIHIDLKYVEEQRLNLLSKYNKIIFELNKCRDDLLVLKQAKLEAVTFQIQNTKLIKLNHALQDQLKEERKLTDSSSKNDAKDNPFVPASMDYDHEMASSNPESSKESGSESQTPLPLLKNLQGASSSSKVMTLTYQDHSPRERSGLGTMKHIKPETQESSNKNVSGPVTILKSKAKPYPPCTYYGFNNHHPDDCRNYPECQICRSYDYFTSEHNCIIQIRGGVLAESSQSSESSIGRHIREPIWYLDSGCSRSMTSVKSYLHKYVEQPGPKVVFGDNSSCITERYGSINYGGIVFSKQGTIFNANKEIVLIAPRRNDVYVFDMTSLTLSGACIFAKASESVNWLWHKRLSHLNFKNINKLVKQNKVLGFPSLVYSKDKPCSACEKGKHKRASFKTKQNFSIKKCLHLIHMDLFGPVSPLSINHEKYTLVIVDEYSRYTWLYFLRKKSQAAEMIMSFVRMVKNQNDIKVTEIRTDNGTEFRNTKLESFCDEKGISQKFSSPYTLKQNGVAERKNRTFIEASRTMMNGSVLSKHFWTEAVRIACYTHNRSIIVKIHDRTPYERFRERMPDIRYFHVFGCHVFIHNHKDHLGKFDAKADDGYFLGYSFNFKAFKEDDPSRQYQTNSDISYYIIPHGRSLTKITQEKHVPEVIALNEQDNPQIEDVEGPSDPPNTKETSRINTEISVPITESLAHEVSYDLREGMLTRSMAAKLIVASASECLFADFLSEIEPKKVFEALKHPGWVDTMQKELNQFYRNKVWTLVLLLYGKIDTGSK